MGSRLCGGGRFLGATTNNVAEYQALLWGLRTAIHLDARPLTVYSDSELVVRQLSGEYKVKNHGLRPLHAEAVRLIGMLGDVSVVHVPREANTEADALANAAMDAAGIVGDVPADDHPAAQGTLFR